MGYTAEDMRAGGELLAHQRIDYPRNGMLPVLIDVPFLLAGGADERDYALSFEPCIVTALLVTVLFLWCSRITGSRRYGLAIALMAAFCTMLWPYAYIGLEPKQSLFLLVAAYLAIEHERPRRWMVAVCSESRRGSLFQRNRRARSCCPRRRFWCGATRGVSLTVRDGGFAWVWSACCWVRCSCSNAWTRAFFWAQYGGSFAFIRPWIVSDIVSPFLNFAAFFGSPNKGLWVYSPVCFLTIFAIPRAFHFRRDLTLFALLTLGGLAGGFSLLTNWSDETWGPRYLHSAICPLLLVLATGIPRPSRAFRAALAIAAVLGFGAAVLGVAFSYSSLAQAANVTGLNTLENYQGNLKLNHLLFNTALLDEWWHQRHGTWSTAPRWFFTTPADAPAVKSINLAEYAIPQPILFRWLPVPRPLKWRILLESLVGGAGSMLWVSVVVWVAEAKRLRPVTELPQHPARTSVPPSPSVESRE